MLWGAVPVPRQSTKIPGVRHNITHFAIYFLFPACMCEGLTHGGGVQVKQEEAEARRRSSDSRPASAAHVTLSLVWAAWRRSLDGGLPLLSLYYHPYWINSCKRSHGWRCSSKDSPRFDAELTKWIWEPFTWKQGVCRLVRCCATRKPKGYELTVLSVFVLSPHDSALGWSIYLCITDKSDE